MFIAMRESPNTSPDSNTISPSNLAPLTAALNDVLRQTAAVVESLADEDYIAPANGQASGAIGGHVRHCLDHVSALLVSVDAEIDYDLRKRGTPVERDRLRAVERIHELQRAIDRLANTPADRPVRVRVLVGPTGPVLTVPSSIGRELSFVLSHTIHHNAMIASAAAARGVATPKNFGYAPSTVVYHAPRACVPSPCCV
jgi:hypothetical protein